VVYDVIKKLLKGATVVKGATATVAPIRFWDNTF